MMNMSGPPDPPQAVEHYWRVERAWGPRGSKWHIVPLTDWAGLLMERVGTPPVFDAKRDAKGWLYGSLATHLTSEEQALEREPLEIVSDARS
jgi:hypothetical protein